MSATQMPWIKLYTELLDDPKVSELKLSEQMVFVKLLLFAGECDCEGLIGDAEGGYSMSKIAWRLRIPAADLRHAVAKLLSLGLVEEREGGLLVPAFTARQGRPQAERQQMWRERQQRKRHPEEAVTHVSPVTPRPRGEERREEKSRGEKTEGAAARPRGTHPEPHPAIVVFREEAGLYPKRSMKRDIEDAVGSTEEGLALWREVVHSWIARGYKPTNIEGPLQWFKAGGVPERGNGKALEPKGFQAIRDYDRLVEANRGE